MATLRLYLDARSTPPGKKAPLKIAVNHRTETAFINTGIRLLPEHWDASRSRVIKHPDKQILNNLITKRLSDTETALFTLLAEPSTRLLSAIGIRDRLLVATGFASSRTTFKDVFEDAAKRFKNSSTIHSYQAACAAFTTYDARFPNLTYDDITYTWIRGFLSSTDLKLTQNSRALYLARLGGIFKAAIRDGIITHSPFQSLSIKRTPTRKRNLSPDQLRFLRSQPASPYIDFFFLSFFLIGMNPVDIIRIQRSALVNGRITYKRAKTSRHYDVLVPPEATKIISRYPAPSDSQYLLQLPGNHTPEKYTSFVKLANNHLREIVTQHPDSLPAGLTLYFARHSWATIAASIDIPRDTIAAALGHGMHTVTDIYIDFKQDKVDEANRRVIDFVFRDKK